MKPICRFLVDELLERELPELPVVLVRRVRGPEVEDDVERLHGHGAPLLRVEAVELLVGGDASRAETEVEAAVRQVVEEGDAGRHVGRVVLVEADRGGSQADALGLPEHAADEDLGHDDRLVPHGVVFADPELAETELLGADDQLDVLVETLGQRFARRVKGHDEHAVVDQSVCAHR